MKNFKIRDLLVTIHSQPVTPQAHRVQEVLHAMNGPKCTQPSRVKLFGMMECEEETKETCNAQREASCDSPSIHGPDCDDGGDRTSPCTQVTSPPCPGPSREVCVEEGEASCQVESRSPKCPCPSRKVCKDKKEVSCQQPSVNDLADDFSRTRDDAEQDEPSGGTLYQLKQAIAQLQQKQQQHTPLSF